MYNRGGFNVAPFNTDKTHGRYIDRTRIMGETVDGVIGEQYVLNRTRLINERVSGSLDFSVILPRKRAIHEEIHYAAVEIQTIGWHNRIAMEGISGDAHMGKHMHLSKSLNESLEGDIHIGKYMHTSKYCGEGVEGQPHVGKYMHIGRAMHEEVHNLMNMALQRYQQFYVDTIIPPGAEIRINSNTFTVSLVHNGQTINLRPRFTGDWVHFDRGTQRLYVENEGIQRLTGEVIYNNRWL